MRGAAQELDSVTAKRKRLTLPATATVTVIWSATGPEVQVTGLKPKDADTALRWLQSLWEKRRFPIPGPDTVPGGPATEFVDDVDESEYRRKPPQVGFHA